MQAVAPSRAKTGPANPVTRTGLRRYPPRAADQQARDPATALGGVPREAPGRLPLQPLLRSVPAMAAQAGSRAAAGASGRREAVCRLRRRHDSHLLPPRAARRAAAAIFVAVLGASSYTYAEATATQGLADWIGAHMRTFEFLGGVPEIVVPDNLKSGVTKACRYEPSVNRTYEEMASHYGVAVVPARPRETPRQGQGGSRRAGSRALDPGGSAKAKVLHPGAKSTRPFAELLVRLNDRPFRKREGSRRSLFESLDKPALRALPAERYAVRRLGNASRQHRLSRRVRPPLVQRALPPHATGGGGARHRRHGGDLPPRRARGQPCTQPRAPRRHHRQRAPAQGASAVSGVDALPAGGLGQDHRSGDRRTVRAHHGQQAPSRSKAIAPASAFCGSPSSTTAQRVEAAARRAIALHACSYQSIKSILKCNLDSQAIEPAAAAQAAARPPQHSRLGILRHR